MLSALLKVLAENYIFKFKLIFASVTFQKLNWQRREIIIYEQLESDVATASQRTIRTPEEI